MLFLFQLSSGQVSEMDLKKMSYDELNQIYFTLNNKDLLNKIAKQFVYKAKIEKSNINIARGYYLYSLVDRIKQKEKSIKYLDSVIKYSFNLNDKFYPVAAYTEKAYLLSQLSKFKETIEVYLVAEKYAKQRNDLDNYYLVRQKIGFFKSEVLGEIDEAIELYLECKNYYQQRDYRNSYYGYNYQRILFSLADAHKTIKNIDSSSYYNRLGYLEANLSKEEHNKFLFVLNEGANQVENKNFDIALDSIKTAFPKMTEFNDTGNILASYYYFGRCYEGMKNSELAIKYYKKVDSIYNEVNHITPEFVSGYRYLISYYKNTGEKSKQLKYLTTFMKIDSTLNKGYKNWNKLLKDKYDFPHLIEDKENLIFELKNEKKNHFFIITSLILLVSVILFFAVRQFQLKKSYKVRFENLIKNNSDEKIENTIEILKSNNSENIGIAEEIIESIMKQLNQFEKNKGFLNSSITLQNLAQDFNTNSKYLSIIINAKKEKTFIQYINDLKVDNIIYELKNDSNLRKYTINAIAEEAGFNTAESFSKAFFKRTGIKPSYFIKELKQNKELNFN